jgi:hypothetical protein
MHRTGDHTGEWGLGYMSPGTPVGSKLGLAGRFDKQICNGVAKTLSVTELAHLGLR